MLEGRASESPVNSSPSSIVFSPHFLLPHCTTFTAEHRDGASQGGRRRRGEGLMKRELKADVRKGMKRKAWWRENAAAIFSAQKEYNLTVGKRDKKNNKQQSRDSCM